MRTKVDASIADYLSTLYQLKRLFSIELYEYDHGQQNVMTDLFQGNIQATASRLD
jgi:hypothetical protein